MASRSPEQKLMDRMRHLPVATENTVRKLEALLAEHEAYRMPIDEIYGDRKQIKIARLKTREV